MSNEVASECTCTVFFLLNLVSGRVLFIPVTLLFLLLSPSQRTAEDIEVIYEELLHVKAAAHLSTSVSLYLPSSS